MTTDNSLVVIEHAMSPAQFDQSIEEASAKARTLSKLVEAQHLYTKMGQGKHIHVEAWITIGKSYGLTAGILPDAKILYDLDGNEIGAQAQSVIPENGVIVGGAPGFCMRKGQWTNKPIEQLISMAGTRAVSKAFRLLLSYVVVLAGYSPTPYEEMDNEKPEPAPKRQPGRQQRKPAAAPKTPEMTLQDLQDWVEAQEIDWDYFVSSVVGEGHPWDEWVELGGTPTIAKTRWDRLEHAPAAQEANGEPTPAGANA